MQLSDIRTRCKDRWRDPTNAILSDANWTAYINDAYADVKAASPFWPWAQTSSSSITIAANARTGTLPTDVLGVTAVYNVTDQTAMQPVEGSDRPYRIWPDQVEQGVVGAYRLRGSTIEVYPLPDKTITLKIEFQSVPPDLAADADVPVFPSQFHRMLVAGALVRAYEDDGASASTIQQYQDSFDALLEALKEYVFKGTTSRYPGITDTFYDV